MENNHPPHLLLTLLLFLTMVITTNQTTPSPSPSPSPSLPPPMEQLNNIIDALIGASDFSSWVSILSRAKPTVIPLSATLLIPQDNTLDHQPIIDPFLLPYHVIPQRLTFSQLLLFPRNSRLPTLLPGKSISVTDNSQTNFSLNAIPVTRPDLYSSASLAVHGLRDVLNYSLFGDGIPPPSSPPPFLPIGDSIGIAWRSRAVNVSFSFLFLFFCFVLQQLMFV